MVLNLLIIVISIYWYLSIDFHKNTNNAKFKIMEAVSLKLVNISLFDDEYKIFNSDSNRRMTGIEKVFPIMFGTISFILLFYELFAMIL